MEVGRAGLLVIRAHPVVCDGLISLYDDVVTLPFIVGLAEIPHGRVIPPTDIDVEDRSLIRHNGDKISLNNSHLVAVDLELVRRLDSTVDNAEKMLLARLEVETGTRTGLVGAAVSAPHVLTVDETIVHGGDTTEGNTLRLTRLLSGVLRARELGVDGLVAPIRKEDGVQLFVELCAVRTVDNQRAHNTGPGLDDIVGVVP